MLTSADRHEVAQMVGKGIAEAFRNLQHGSGGPTLPIPLFRAGVSASAAGPGATVSVKVDGDTEPITALNLAGGVSSGARVMVLFVPPHGVYIIAPFAGMWPPGIIIATGGLVADPGWSLCDGGVLSRTLEGARLFGKFGTRFGAGNGTTTFNKPDLRGRVIVMQGGAIAGALGATGGAATHTLSPAEMPSHVHVSAANVLVDGLGVLGVNFPASPFGVGAPSTTSAGGDQPHNNVQPYMLLNAQVSL